MKGLGHLGLENTEAAEQAFTAALTLDAEHLGAKIHSIMPIQYKKV